jgi:sugar phosphate isomerase/epimerase
MNTLHDTGEAAARLLDLVEHSRIIANLDPGNMVAVREEDPFDAGLRALGKRLGYVHLKNARLIAGSYDYSWAIDDGDIDWRVGLDKIRASGYSGDYCIEYCGRGDPCPRLHRDIRYLRALLENARS